MPSIKQIQANKRNGKLGGPKTKDGKNKIRFNALKHGLTASIYQNEEDRTGYKIILDELISEFNPEGIIEGYLVQKMALSIYRTIICAKIEDQFLHNPSSQFSSTNRYIPSIEDLIND